MPKYFKKLFLVVLAVIISAAAIAPSATNAAIRPARPSFKVVKRAKKSVKLKINKTKNATGYQIFISNSRNGKYKQTAASRIRTVKITKLKKNKVYYIKVRAFKTVGYHITFGRFSKAVKIDKYGKKPKPEKPSSGTDETPSPEVPSGPAITYEPSPEETGNPSTQGALAI
ncbi:MAG: hypothetical protein K1W24_00780 [Lachnospiraceae bacterium]